MDAKNEISNAEIGCTALLISLSRVSFLAICSRLLSKLLKDSSADVVAATAVETSIPEKTSFPVRLKCPFVILKFENNAVKPRRPLISAPEVFKIAKRISGFI